MTANRLVGERLRLAAIDLEKDLPALAAWSRDTKLLPPLQPSVARLQQPHNHK